MCVIVMQKRMGSGKEMGARGGEERWSVGGGRCQKVIGMECQGCCVWLDGGLPPAAHSAGVRLAGCHRCEGFVLIPTLENHGLGVGL